MPAAFSTVPCAELHGTRTESGDSQGVKASVRLECAWADRLALASDLLDNSRAWPDFTDAKAVTVAIAPLAAEYTQDGQQCVYTKAHLTVNYSSNPDQEIISESIEPTAEFRRLDHRSFRWGSATGSLLNPEEAPGMLVRGVNIVRTMHKLPSVPSSVLTLPGSCNSAPYTSSLLGLTFAAQTLLFGINPITRTIKVSGSTGFTLAVKFAFRAAGWNKYWNESTQSYQSIYLFGGGVYNSYPPASFSEYLF